MAVKKKRVQLLLTMPYVDALALLVEREIYSNRQVAFRDALRRLFRFYKIPPFYLETEG